MNKSAGVQSLGDQAEPAGVAGAADEDENGHKSISDASERWLFDVEETLRETRHLFILRSSSDWVFVGCVFVTYVERTKYRGCVSLLGAELYMQDGQPSSQFQMAYLSKSWLWQFRRQATMTTLWYICL
jgi:hypothetical protein